MMMPSKIDSVVGSAINATICRFFVINKISK